jgi:hypothetical protein
LHCLPAWLPACLPVCQLDNSTASYGSTVQVQITNSPCLLQFTDNSERCDSLIDDAFLCLFFTGYYSTIL